MTLDETIRLVRRIHGEGVTRFEFNPETGAIKVEFAPEFVARPAYPDDGTPETMRPFDAKLCMQCQKNPAGDMMPGACDQCALAAAGAR